MTTLATSPRYAKFFRMLRVGLPEGAVRQLMRAQGVDERVLAFGPDALECELPWATTETAPTGPAVDTRVYQTSLRMLLVGVPQAAVENALRVRSLDARVYEQTLGKLRATLALRHGPVATTTTSETAQQATVATQDQDDATTAMMARVGVPQGAIQQRLQLLRETQQRHAASPWTNLFMTATDPNDTTRLKDHAPLRRFFAMLRAGVAQDAVQSALTAAGLPQEVVYWDPMMSVGVLAGPPGVQ